jgi:hypothetical protein
VGHASSKCRNRVISYLVAACTQEIPAVQVTANLGSTHEIVRAWRCDGVVVQLTHGLSFRF